MPPQDLGLECACIMQVHNLRSGVCEGFRLIMPVHSGAELEGSLGKVKQGFMDHLLICFATTILFIATGQS